MGVTASYTVGVELPPVRFFACFHCSYISHGFGVGRIALITAGLPLCSLLSCLVSHVGVAMTSKVYNFSPKHSRWSVLPTKNILIALPEDAPVSHVIMVSSSKPVTVHARYDCTR